MNACIETMTIEDYDAVNGLWLRIPGMGMRSLDDSREGIARYLARNPGTCFVSRSEGKVTGSILAGHDGRRGYIYHVCVEPALRGQGMGESLVKAALTALRGEGINKVALVCFRDNETGNRFWSGHGWTLRNDLCYYDQSLNEENR